MKNYFLFSVLTVILTMITILSGSWVFAQNITIDGRTDDWAAALNGNPIKVYVRDANDTNDDQFTQGSQDPDLISEWGWVLGNTNDKGDISNAAAVLIGNRIYFAGDRTAVNGDAQIGFWFFTNGTVKTADGKFAPDHSIGDLLVLSNFTNGGGAVNLRIYKWVGSGGSDGSLDLIATNTNAFVNNMSQPVPVYPGWTYQGKNVPSQGTPPPNTYATGSFFEGYVDLSPGSNISPCFSSFILETRNSASVSASLQDFVGGAFNIKPMAPQVTPGKKCGPGNVTVSASCGAGTQVRWYATADSATPLSSGGNITIDGNSLTANISETTTFYAVCYNASTGCESARTPVVATVNNAPVITVEYTTILCNGGESTVTVSASGGTAPYSGTGTFQVKAGTYTYTVTDANGCIDSKEITISQPDPLVIKVEYTPILCNGGESTVTVSASGGTAPYSGTGTFQVKAGTYTYEVTDANGCKDSKEIMISQPDPLVITVEYTPILCNGGESTVTVSASGGTPPYSGTGTFQVKAGTYTYEVTDANGCKDSKEIMISQPDPLVITVEYTPILCNGGESTVTVSASGGTAPYNGTGTFQVKAGTYTYEVTDANGCKDSKEIMISQPDPLVIKVEYTPIKCNGGESTVTVSASGGTPQYTGTGTFQMKAGKYTYTVTDVNGCTDSKEITISEPDPLVIKVEYTPILCNGGESTVTVSASGGTPPYSGTGTFQVKAGTYTYEVTDANGCKDSKEIMISQPDPLVIKVEYTPILCNGGESTVTVSASGGTAPYSGTGTFQVKAGTYTYTVTDANGCTDAKEIMISQPDPLVIKVEYTPILCNGGESTVTVSASGGTPPYSGTGTFQVKAGTYTYEVTDANGCKDSKEIMISQPDPLVIKVEYTPILCNGGQSTVTVSASGGTAPYTGTGTFTVGIGTYNYMVSDANGCTDAKEIVITQPDPLKVELSAPPITCSSETVMVTATPSGGTAPYTYLWSNGSTDPVAYLGVGLYSVTVTDANGCTASANGEIKPPVCGGFTTVTQGGWGAKASGNNWGKYRDNNFAAAFPTGLTVGYGANLLKLTSAKAVEDFLPSGSTARALDPGTMTNPGGGYSNVLAGQTVALTLNVRFDLYDPKFSSNTGHLGDLIVISGPFANWTVNQILAEANKILGGQPSMYSPSEINAIVDAINNNYDGGKMNLGLLACPCPGAVAPVVDNGPVAAAKAPVPEMSGAVVLYPNPSSGEFNIRFEAAAGSQIVVQLYDMTGKLVGDYSAKVLRNGNKAHLNVSNANLAGGLYLVKVKTSELEKTIKLMIRK